MPQKVQNPGNVNVVFIAIYLPLDGSPDRLCMETQAGWQIDACSVPAEAAKFAARMHEKTGVGNITFEVRYIKD